MKNNKDSFAEEVSNRLIKMLKEGIAPWTKPWESSGFMPFNETTGNEYKGGNALWLIMQGKPDPRWMTYKQAKDNGMQVKKGEKGTRLEFWKFYSEKSVYDSNGKPKKDSNGNKITEKTPLSRPICKMFTVFNGEQVEGIEPYKPKKLNEWQRHEQAEKILSASKADIKHVEGNRALYSPLRDQIVLPVPGQFESKDLYYATALHELGHWTGHKSRLDRDMGGSFGSEAYAKEELRAEIFSMVMGDKLQIGHDPARHASYIDSWIQVLEKDPREIFRASADAVKIKEYVLELEKAHDKNFKNEKTLSKSDELEASL